MSSIIHSDEYAVLIPLLAEKREQAGLSQRALARRLCRSQTHVQKLFSGQGRIELVEFCRVLKQIGADPSEVLEEFLTRLKARQQPKPACEDQSLEIDP